MSRPQIAVVDTGPVVAAFDMDDANHERSIQILNTPGLRLVYPALVITEILYFIALRLGPGEEVGFLSGLAAAWVENPHPQDWPRIAQLVATYHDFPLGGVDASIVAVAERLNTDVIVTLDRRHFAAVRPRHVAAFRLLPE